MMVSALALACLSACATAVALDRATGQCSGALGDETALMQVMEDSVELMSSDASVHRAAAQAPLPPAPDREVAREQREDLKCEGETVPELQIAFAMDCTGSTKEYLTALKQTVTGLSSDLQSKTEKLQMAFLCYRDEGDVFPFPRFEWARPDNKWFTKAEALQEAMQPFDSVGGGDKPEDNAGGMGQALKLLTWDADAIRMLMVISKDRDSIRRPFGTESAQCELMGQLKAAGLHLVLGHMDNNAATSMMADVPRWRACYDDARGAIQEVDVTGHTDASSFEAILFRVVCDVIVDPGAKVTGDPHVTNLNGERFNLVRGGTHELLRMPRQTPTDQAEPLLQVLGRVEESRECTEAYVREVGVQGAWLRAIGRLVFRANGSSLEDADAVVVQVNGTRLGPKELERDPRFEGMLEVLEPNLTHVRRSSTKIRRIDLLTLKLHLPAATLKTVWVHRKVPGGSRINHINFVASGLPRRGGAHEMDIGGILGRDDHTEASTPSQDCRGALQILPWIGRDMEPAAQLLKASYEEQP